MGIAGSSPLPQYVTNLIKATAKRLKGKHRFTESDVGDIEQEITLAIVRGLAKFSVTRAQEHPCFTRLVTHAVSDMLSARTREGRDYRREEGSLDQWAKDDSNEWVRRAESVTEEDARRHLGLSGRSEETTQDLRIDLRAVVDRLPEPLRSICGHLMRCDTIREVADAAGVHRSTVYLAIRQIREVFMNAGLGEYPNSGDPSDTSTVHAAGNGGRTHT